MRIDNKLESIKKINELCFNKFLEQLFKENEQDKVKEFLHMYPAKYCAKREHIAEKHLEVLQKYEKYFT